MNYRNGILRAIVAIGLAVGMANESGAQTLQGTAFTYQGELRQNGNPLTGNTDMVFELYDAAVGGNPVGTPLTFTAGNGNPVVVSNGIFTVALDFGAVAFNTLASNERYLKVTVNGTPLAPRTKIENAPYALQSRTAELAYSVSNASVGTAQIVPTQVQQRVTGTCTVGSSIQSIAQNGTVTCQASGSGTVTSVGSGSGLTGGPITGSGTLAVDTAAIQTRINGTCTVGQKMLAVNSDGTAVCADDATGGSGTVTSVGSGNGLTGGPITGSGTLAVDTSVIQARVGGTCPLGEYVRGINADGSVVCVGVQRIATVDATGNVGQFMSIAIGNDGFPVVSYFDTININLKVAHCANSACIGSTNTNVDTVGFVGSFTSIAIGIDGLPVVSYNDDTNSDLKVAHCSNATCTAATITAVDNVGAVGPYTSIAIGNDGRPVVSYLDSTNLDLKVAHCANAACTGIATLTTVDAAGNVGQYTSIAIGNDGLPVVSYYDNTNDNLKVAHCNDAACTATTITTVDAAGDVGSYSSIAIGSDGLPIISYYDTTNADLKVAHCANAACTGVATITILDASSGAGQHTSIAVGSDGLPVVSYRGGSSKLTVAHCANVACAGAASIIGVDLGSPSGSYTSLAISSDGMPVVSYEASGDLKVLKCDNLYCQ